MTGYTQGYNRNTRSPKFYDTHTGHEEYNPETTYYYTTISGSDTDGLVRIDEYWRGVWWSQIIVGSNYDQQWPDYTYSITYNGENISSGLYIYVLRSGREQSIKKMMLVK